MSKENITRRISVFVNGVEVENSMKKIDSAASHLRNQLRSLDRSTEEGRKKFAELKPEYDKAREAQQQFREELGLTKKTMDDGAGSFAKLKDGLLSGDFKSAKEGLSGLKTELVNLVKTSLAFIATPLGAAIAVLSGIVLSTKFLFDFNTELEKSNKTLRAFGVAAEDLSKVRSEIEATAKTFDKEFDEIAEKANSLSKSYKISISEANRIIAQGLIEGGAQNKEFLDSIGEYDEFFSKAGYSAEEFINVINKGFDLGIYSDKLPDALKEADLALKEQTKSSRDALENAFGTSFSDSILARVSAGTITTKQALQEIAAESKKTQLSQQQQAQLTADIFKGAGEDAGGALKILEAVGVSAKKELSDSAKAQQQLLEANEKLNKAQAELFEIEGFGGMWDVIKAQATTALADIISYISDLKKDIQPLIDIVGILLVAAWINLKFAVVTVFDIIGAVVKSFFNSLKFGFDFIKAIITLDFKGAINLLKSYFVNLGDSVSNIFNKIKNNIINAIQGIVANISPVLTALGFDVDKIQKKLESFKSIKPTENAPNGKTPDNPEAGNTKILSEELAKQKALRDAARQKEADARKAAADKKKAEQEKAAKEELDKALALAKAKGDLAKAELAYFISVNASKLDSTKKLTPDIIAEETNRLAAIKDQQLTALAEERLSKVEKAQADAKTSEELVALKQIIDFDYETNRQNLELGFQVSTDELKKQYIEEQKVLAAEQLLADNELALIEAETKEEADAIKRDQDYQKEKDDYKKLLDDKKITQEEYNRFIVAIDKKKEEDTRLAKINSVAAQLQEMGKLADATIAIFGQNKAAASAMALINGGLAVTEILKTESVLPEPLASISRVIQIAGAVAMTARSIAQINKSNAPKRAKFFYGGDTGNFPALGHDEFGPMTGIVHDGEYVVPKAMRQNPRYANTIAWLESERTGKRTRKFAAGGDVSSKNIPDAVITENESEMKSLLRAVLFRLENPIAPKLNFGYQDAKDIQNLNDERNQSTSNGTISE